MKPEEVYKKQTGVPATYPFYVHSVGYVKWLEEQNAKLLEAAKGALARFRLVEFAPSRFMDELEQAIKEAEGQS